LPKLESLELQLSDDLYLRFRDLLLARTGLHYPERKRADLLHGLSMVMHTGDYASIAALYQAAVEGGPAWDLLLVHLTIGETYFFRNEPQFDALRQHILPEILQRRATTRTLRVWSAGCATGEEPYSLAMTIGELLGNQSPWNTTILATDINPQFLVRAREGLYSEWSFRATPDELRARFWIKEHSRWRLRPEIRSMVNFALLNLAEPSYPSIINGTCMIDLLVCRNVTIYFDDRTTQQVIDRFFNALAPGGWLIVGHAEPQASVYRQFEVYNFPNTVVYRKPLDAPLFAFDTQRELRPIAVRQPVAVQQPVSLVSLPLPELVAAERAIASTAPIASRATIAALVKLGRQCADRADWPAAVAYCEQALNIDPLWIDAHYLLAQIHEHQGMVESALANYRRTVFLDRNFVPGLIGLGTIWQQLGRTQEARRSYQAALAQLAQLPATTPIAGSDGATAQELIAQINQHLRALK
jgi:chemotaxis protein methyltransferase CheR